MVLNVAMWQCGIVAFSDLHKNPLPKREGLSPPLGEDGRGLILTQVVHDAVHLTGCESALAAGVAELGELFGERLTKLNP